MNCDFQKTFKSQTYRTYLLEIFDLPFVCGILFFTRFYTRHGQNDTSPLPAGDRNDVRQVRMETTRRCVVIGRRSNKFVSRSAVRSL